MAGMMGSSLTASLCLLEFQYTERLAETLQDETTAKLSPEAVSELTTTHTHTNTHTFPCAQLNGGQTGPVSIDSS